MFGLRGQIDSQVEMSGDIWTCLGWINLGVISIYINTKRMDEIIQGKSVKRRQEGLMQLKGTTIFRKVMIPELL